ncbi:MAG: hypothetical protein DRJ56_06020, partial [Thermoprotei archaeon]
STTMGRLKMWRTEPPRLEDWRSYLLETYPSCKDEVDFVMDYLIFALKVHENDFAPLPPGPKVVEPYPSPRSWTSAIIDLHDRHLVERLREIDEEIRALSRAGKGPGRAAEKAGEMEKLVREKEVILKRMADVIAAHCGPEVASRFVRTLCYPVPDLDLVLKDPAATWSPEGIEGVTREEYTYLLMTMVSSAIVRDFEEAAKAKSIPADDSVALHNIAPEIMPKYEKFLKFFLLGDTVGNEFKVAFFLWTLRSRNPAVNTAVALWCFNQNMLPKELLDQILEAEQGVREVMA